MSGAPEAGPAAEAAGGGGGGGGGPWRRLIEKGLMFGDLLRVEGPVMVERYGRALKHLTGKGTALTEFHIDASGYSPEVGDEIGDERYLSGGGLNRRFILLDLAQVRGPLLDPELSTTRGVLQRFVAANEAQLFALTARDAVAGEVVAAPYGAATPASLLSLGRVTVEADTTSGTVASAEKLEGLVRRFKAEPDAWWDDQLIAEMVALSRVAGDLTRNPVKLRETQFEQGDLWTPLWGGAYAFVTGASPAVVAADPAQLGDLPAEVVALGDRTGVARLLAARRLAEPVVAERGEGAAAVLRSKMDLVAAHALGARGLLPATATARDVRALARRHADALPPEWRGLAALVAWAEEGARWPRLTSEDPAFFYSLRARPGPAAEVVNRLLAELSALDARQLFICHKELFYRLYRTWPEAYQAYVADALAQGYLRDKAGTLAALFGRAAAPEAHVAPPPGPWSRPAAAPEAPAEEARGDPLGDLVARVGPWSSLRPSQRRL